MIYQKVSHRRLRLERLEGRWLMAAGGMDLLDVDHFGHGEPSGQDIAHHDRQHQRGGDRERGGDRAGQHQQPKRHEPGPSTIAAQQVDRVFRHAGDPIRDQPPRHDRPPRNAQPSAHNFPVTQPFSTATLAVFTPLTNQPPLPVAPTNPVLPIHAPFVTPSNPVSAPQGERLFAPADRNEIIGRPGNESATDFNQRDIETVDTAETLAEISNNVEAIDATSATTLVSFHSRDTKVFFTDASFANSLSQLIDDSEKPFLELTDEAIRQSGLSQWLGESESMQLELAELDRLLETLAQTDARIAELGSRQVHRTTTSTLNAAPSSDWAHAVGKMILLLPGPRVQPTVVGDLSMQPAETSAAWSAGIGLYRAFDFAGFDTELDEAVATVSVSVDAESWNLIRNETSPARPATNLAESIVLPTSTSTTVGFAITVLGMHYLRGRYRRILISKHQRNAYVTNIGTGRTGCE